MVIHVPLPRKIVKFCSGAALLKFNILSQTPLEYIKNKRCATVTVGTRLRMIRKGAGLSQVELGKLVGSDQSVVNRYETDRVMEKISSLF